MIHHMYEVIIEIPGQENQTVSDYIHNFISNTVQENPDKTISVAKNKKLHGIYGCRELVSNCISEFNKNIFLLRAGYKLIVKVRESEEEDDATFLGKVISENNLSRTFFKNCYTYGAGDFKNGAFHDIKSPYGLSFMLYLLRFGLENKEGMELLSGIFDVNDDDTYFEEKLFIAFFAHYIGKAYTQTTVTMANGPSTFSEHFLYTEYGQFKNFLTLIKSFVQPTYKVWSNWYMCKKNRWGKEQYSSDLLYNILKESLGE